MQTHLQGRQVIIRRVTCANWGKTANRRVPICRIMCPDDHHWDRQGVGAKSCMTPPLVTRGSFWRNPLYLKAGSPGIEFLNFPFQTLSGSSREGQASVSPIIIAWSKHHRDMHSYALISTMHAPRHGSVSPCSPVFPRSRPIWSCASLRTNGYGAGKHGFSVGTVMTNIDKVHLTSPSLGP